MGTQESLEIECIYCEGQSPHTFEIGKGSLEHVILSSIGGRKGSRNVCCVTCNTRLGNEIDNKLSQKLAPLSNLFEIKTDRKRAAPTLHTEHLLDGKQLVVAPGGKFQLLHPSVRESKKKDGKAEISISARNREEADRLRSEYLKKFKSGTLSDPIYIAKSTPSPVISHKFSFEANDKRSCAKMLLTLLATCVDPKRIRSSDMRPAIEYICGKGSPALPVVPWLSMEIPEVDKKYSFGHVAIILVSNTYKAVFGVLILFGSIKVTAKLADQWSGPTLGQMYCIDPVTGAGETKNIEIVEVDRCIHTYVEDCRPSNEEFSENWKLMLAELRRRHQAKQVEDFVNEIIALVPQGASAEKIGLIIEEPIARFVHEVLRIPYERKLDK